MWLQSWHATAWQPQCPLPISKTRAAIAGKTASNGECVMQVAKAEVRQAHLHTGQQRLRNGHGRRCWWGPNRCGSARGGLRTLQRRRSKERCRCSLLKRHRQAITHLFM